MLQNNSYWAPECIGDVLDFEGALLASSLVLSTTIGVIALFFAATAFTEENSNRRALETKAFTETILEKSYVRGPDRLGVAAKYDDDGRPDRDLRGIEELVGLSR